MAGTEELEVKLGGLVRSRRLAKGYSRVEVARQANVSVGAVGHLEKGEGANLRTLMRVLKVLEATEWLDKLEMPAPSFSPRDVWKAQQAAAAQSKKIPRVRRKAVEQ